MSLSDNCFFASLLFIYFFAVYLFYYFPLVENEKVYARVLNLMLVK